MCTPVGGLLHVRGSGIEKHGRTDGTREIKFKSKAEHEEQGHLQEGGPGYPIQ